MHQRCHGFLRTNYVERVNGAEMIAIELSARGQGLRPIFLLELFLDFLNGFEVVDSLDPELVCRVVAAHKPRLNSQLRALRNTGHTHSQTTSAFG